MKLIYILNSYSTKSCEHFYHIIHLLQTLAEKGVQIRLIIEKADGIPEDLHPNISARVLSMQKGSIIGRYCRLSAEMFSYARKGYKNIFVRISMGSTVCAILTSLFSMQTVFYWHSGTVFEFDDLQPFSRNKLRWYLRTRLPFIFIKKTVDYFVSGPEKMLSYYRDVVGVNKKKLRLLYNDIDLSRFSNASPEEKVSLKQKYNIGPTAYVCLFVHRFSPVRMSRLYLPLITDRFFSEQPQANVLFVFVGTGKDKEPIETTLKTREYANRIRFMGEMPNSEIQELYRLADLYFNPTHAEGFPRTLIEAMACGLPVVTTNAGGIDDILPKEQKSYISDIDVPEDFASNLLEAYRQREQTTALGLSNKHEVVRFSTPLVAEMYIDLFSEGRVPKSKH